MNIRAQPNTSSESVGMYLKGEQFVVDSSTMTKEGVWYSFIGASGLRRYVYARNFKTFECYVEPCIFNKEQL